VLRCQCSSPNANKPGPEYEAKADERGKREERCRLHGSQGMHTDHVAQESQGLG